MKGPRATIFIAQKKLETDPAMKKRKATEANAPKKEKASKKIPGAPKRPPSAFFVFMEDFRKSYKENFPDNKSAAAVTKAGGEKWKALSESEKAPHVVKAAKKKAEYEKAMEAFTKNLNGQGESEMGADSEKSSSETNGNAEQEASS